ncbi:uncharacterized protein LOC113352869 [Papaver somniferum]|uniref:uncharacterized protein LOC113352869 n=1 Tax=Papaver somniferum TaxID=3469 RepID=UPI000E701D5F|nr:uncharacterized protein LOC113352869 [Papaver somniferum]
MQFYIEGTHYVLSDGHCGFHSIAFQLGLACRDDFRHIRNNMHAEVFNHMTFYVKVLYSEERLNNMLKRLRFEDGDEMDVSKWFKMPEDGLVAAQTFRDVLVWLSKEMCATFFPSRHGPIKGKKHRVIVMAFVGGNHFVPMKLKLGAPIPPPCNMWIQNAYEDAKVWPKKYEDKMKTFKKRMNFKEPQPEKPVIIH